MMFDAGQPASSRSGGRAARRSCSKTRTPFGQGSVGCAPFHGGPAGIGKGTDPCGAWGMGCRAERSAIRMLSCRPAESEQQGWSFAGGPDSARRSGPIRVAPCGSEAGAVRRGLALLRRGERRLERRRAFRAVSVRAAQRGTPAREGRAGSCLAVEDGQWLDSPYGARQSSTSFGPIGPGADIACSQKRVAVIRKKPADRVRTGAQAKKHNAERAASEFRLDGLRIGATDDAESRAKQPFRRCPRPLAAG